MVAASEIQESPSTAPAAVVEAAPAVPPVGHVDLDDRVQVRAERSFWRTVVTGMVVGMVVGAGVWTLLVLVAVVGTDWSLSGPLWMGAVVGFFMGGPFLGGWAGVVVACGRLEEAEHHYLPQAAEH